jgi:hypothetical protein
MAAVPPALASAGDTAGVVSSGVSVVNVDFEVVDAPEASGDVETSGDAEASDNAVPVSYNTTEATSVAESIYSAEVASTLAIIDGVEAVDVTAAVDAMFNDTLLFHRLSKSDVDAVDICKSYAFDASQVNWHLANTEEWMRTYAIANQHRDFFKRNGLIATIAFDFLGFSGFKCAVGTSHLCTIDCPTVVRSVENLETARHVYFTLVSASHMLTVMEIIDVSISTCPTLLFIFVFYPRPGVCGVSPAPADVVFVFCSYPHPTATGANECRNL